MLNAKNKDGGCEEWASEVEGASPSGWLLGREAGALPGASGAAKKVVPGRAPQAKKGRCGWVAAPSPKKCSVGCGDGFTCGGQGCEKWVLWNTKGTWCVAQFAYSGRYMDVLHGFDW